MNIGHDDGTELLEEEASDKHTEPQVSSSGLPLVLSEKVHRSKVGKYFVLVIGFHFSIEKAASLEISPFWKAVGKSFFVSLQALVECEGESIDLSGDMGAVGRIVILDTPSRNHEMFLDLKGTIYKTTIVPSRTFCIVSFGQSEAKVEAVMNDFIQLKPQSNVYEAETMVEG
ncbi:DNA-binding protein BIN4 [Vitis vinifera]|uniref:DNA-binding protein BIN4 n=1 Tax=Vitis vinifera TaxID=29760 RepID=A0A438E0S8_VITVI|nr:DNA-binding protein BIN4 [Vitis vinifera]